MSSTNPPQPDGSTRRGRDKWSEMEIELLLKLKNQGLEWSEIQAEFTQTYSRSLSSMQSKYHDLTHRHSSRRSRQTEPAPHATNSAELIHHTVQLAIRADAAAAPPHTGRSYHAEVVDFAPVDADAEDLQRDGLMWGTYTILVLRGDPKWPSAYATARRARVQGWGPPSSA